jgi:hypothetical protein
MFGCTMATQTAKLAATALSAVPTAVSVSVHVLAASI